jgi:membrane fusion protein, copper/silver efflux system
METMSNRTALAVFVAGALAGVLVAAAYHKAGFTPGAGTASASPERPEHRTPAAAPSTSGDVYIDPAMVQNLGVRSVSVEPRVITESIRTTGYVDYDQERVVQVNARVSGWIQKLHVAYIGQQVRKGQRLLQIYSPELVLTEEDYLRSRRLASGATGEGPAQRDGHDLMVAAESRLRLMGISGSELKRLADSGEVSETVPLQAPASGVVTEIKAVEGSYVKAGDAMYTLSDLSRVWVYADIYERELPDVKVGQKAEVTSDALAGRTFRGIVSYIYPNVTEQTRTVRVRLEFPNPAELLKPGMYVKTTLIDESPEEMLAVPTEAVMNSGVRHIVIVDRGRGHFAPREITVGAESGGYYPVLSGLSKGERVVTSAQFLIDSESNLNEALAAMALGPEAQTTNAPAHTCGEER